MATQAAHNSSSKPYIGRRTGKVINIVARKNSRGFENISDYFPDSASEVDSPEVKSNPKSELSAQPTSPKPYIGRRTGKVINIVARKNSRGFENISDYFPDIDSEDESGGGASQSVKRTSDRREHGVSTVQLASNGKSNQISHKRSGKLSTSITSDSLEDESSPDSAFGSTKDEIPPASDGNTQSSHVTDGKAASSSNAICLKDGNVRSGRNISPDSVKADGSLIALPSPEEDGEGGLRSPKKRLEFSMTCPTPDQQEEKKNNLNGHEPLSSQGGDDEDGDDYVIVEKPNKKASRPSIESDNDVVENVCESDDTFLTLAKRPNSTLRSRFDITEQSKNISLPSTKRSVSTKSKIPVRKKSTLLGYPKNTKKKATTGNAPLEKAPTTETTQEEDLTRTATTGKVSSSRNARKTIKIAEIPHDPVEKRGKKQVKMSDALTSFQKTTSRKTALRQATPGKGLSGRVLPRKPHKKNHDKIKAVEVDSGGESVDEQEEEGSASSDDSTGDHQGMTASDTQSKEENGISVNSTAEVGGNEEEIPVDVGEQSEGIHVEPAVKSGRKRRVSFQDTRMSSRSAANLSRKSKDGAAKRESNTQTKPRKTAMKRKSQETLVVGSVKKQLETTTKSKNSNIPNATSTKKRKTKALPTAPCEGEPNQEETCPGGSCEFGDTSLVETSGEITKKDDEILDDFLRSEQGVGIPDQDSDEEDDESVVRPPKNKTRKTNLVGNTSLEKTVKKSSMVGNEEPPRRSQRNRVPVLQYWKNERIEYDRRKSGWIVKEIIVNPTPETSQRKRKNSKPSTARAKKGPKTNNSSEDNLDEELELSRTNVPDGLEEKINPYVTVINPDTMKEVKMKLLHSSRMLDFRVAVQGEGESDDPDSATLLVDKHFSHGHFGAGQVLLRPGAEKGRQHVRKDTMVFHILSGRVLVSIHNDCFVLAKGSTFFVPEGNVYNLKNLDTKRNARLHFTQIKA